MQEGDEAYQRMVADIQADQDALRCTCDWWAEWHEFTPGVVRVDVHHEMGCIVSKRASAPWN